ncbi:aromatase 2 [Folsomia candida]|uniref:Aromatase 1 n=1 Tax=Folsomia candida TaxID=158441 RepID=A0A226CW36_FOLCA|nr:aromatase 2 [Folsomia candida]OXA36960.1 Aromatase 1 [Folsomia candida]
MVLFPALIILVVSLLFGYVKYFRKSRGSKYFASFLQFLFHYSPQVNPFKTSSTKRINFVDNFICNYNVRHRFWMIPDLCQHISKKYGKLAELDLFGQRIVVVTDHKISNAFMTKHTKRLRQRFGNEGGLKKLNMLHTGLIWNNDVAAWKNNRAIFESTLANGARMLGELSDSYFTSTLSPSIKVGQPNSILTLLRNYTVTMTMEGLFGLDSCKSPSWRDNVKATVGNYFKAWEFFLLTPNTEQLEEEERHKKFCHAITSLSRQILASAKTTNQSKFIEDLALVKANDENQIVQCITEMLLAGTDTSSLTMFYTSLLLTDNPQVGNQLSKLINDSSTPESNTIEQMISNLYYESMRLVSVGPVILRQAEDNISLEGPDFNLKLNKGDGIVFNIAGQNLNEDPFTCAKKFDPNRYDTGGRVIP